MAVQSTREVQVSFTGDIQLADSFAATVNAGSPGVVEVKTFTTGTNTITVPTGGTAPSACTILPPAGNTAVLTLKGVAGDTGIAIHKIDPTSLGLDGVASFVINASSTVTGARLVWT